LYFRSLTIFVPFFNRNILRHKIFSILITLGSLFPFSTDAQEDSKLNNQYWFDLIPHFRISDKLEFYGDASFRIRDEGERKILTVRPSLRWQVSPVFSIHGGLGMFYNTYQSSENIMEIRPWQGLRISWPDIGPLQFKQYFRLEQRYYPSLENLLLHRVRYKIGAKMPLNKKVVQDKAIFIPFSFEWLGTADDDISVIWASESRLTVGAGYVLSSEWQIEFEFMYWWSKNSPGDVFEVTDRVFRVKFIKNGWVFGE